jgi:hypothetical protein
MTDVLRISIQSEEDRIEDPTPVQLLSSLAARGKVGRFTGAVSERRGGWSCVCLLEDDLLQCGEEEGWQIVVGTCAELEDVPEYVGWGQVSVWLEHGDWVLTLCSPDEQEETDNDIVVWERDEFYEHCAATAIGQAPFAPDSSMRLNAALHHIAQP